MTAGRIAPDAAPRLVAALRAEARLLDELATVIRGQRDAMARDDLAAVDDSVHAVHRILITLAEARRRRGQLCALLGSNGEPSLSELETTAGGADNLLGDACRAVRNAADRLARDVEVNRVVLRQVLATGDAYIRTLFGGTGPAPVYAADSRGAGSETARGGALFDRQV